MADEFRLANHGLAVQPIPIDSRTAPVLHHEVACPKARQVVKKVRALAQLYIHLWQRRLDDRPRPGDLAPVDGDAERWMGTAPAAESDQQERPLLIPQFPVYRLQLLSDGRRVQWGELVGPHEDNILYVISGAVAHHHVRRNNGTRTRKILDRDVYHLIGNHHGANLQESQARPRPFTAPPLQRD